MIYQHRSVILYTLQQGPFSWQLLFKTVGNVLLPLVITALSYTYSSQTRCAASQFVSRITHLYSVHFL